MTPEEREAFYDREVAPTLLRLANECKANGLPFIAVVGWSPEDTGETIALPDDEIGIKMKMALWGVRAHGNADALIGQMVKHGEEHGHNSAYLHRLGG
jgi:hypothetical protein